MYLYVERIRDFFWVMRYTNLLFTYLLTYLHTTRPKTGMSADTVTRAWTPMN